MIIPIPVLSIYNHTKVGRWFHYTRVEHRKPTKKYADQMLFPSGYREHSWIKPIEGWDEYWKNNPNPALKGFEA